MDSKIIILDVCGTIIKTQKDILLKSGYFTMIFENKSYDPTEVFFIDFSPNIFHHVLSFMRNPLHPFPIKYSYALDFFDVNYKLCELFNPKTEMCSNCNNYFNIFSLKKKSLCNNCICNYKDCTNRISYSDSHYCSRHECTVTHCKNYVFSNKCILCEDHKCSYSITCFNKVIKDYKYCKGHKCKHELCSDSVYINLPNSCLTHKCRYKECNQASNKISGFCNQHMCSVVGCGCSVSLPNNTSCVDHMCKYNDCTKSSNNISTFCDEHMCVFIGCRHSVLPNDTLCGDHICEFKDCVKIKYTASLCYNHSCLKYDPDYFNNVVPFSNDFKDDKLYVTIGYNNIYYLK